MLPREYTRVEWIESTGSQYIDTGFKPNQDTRIVVDAIPMSVGSASGDCGMFFGSGYPVQQKGFEAYAFGGMITGVYNGVQKDGSAVSAGQRVVIDFNKNVCKITADGKVVLNHTFTAATFTSDVNLALFVIPRQSKYYGRVRAKSCQIYDNGTLVRDYIPCIDANGDANLWDDVNETLAEKVGTFVAGPEVVLQLPQLITDRTQADVEEVRRIRNKVHAAGEEKADEYGFEYIEYPPLNEILTPEEYSAYFAGMRGAYNASDMNRVGNAVQYIADRLTAERYGVYVSPRIGWTEDDFVRQADWNAYLDDVRHLRGILTLLPTTPEITDAMYDGIGFIEANHIEQILVDLDFLITRMIAGYIYSGEVFAGEV